MTKRRVIEIEYGDGRLKYVIQRKLLGMWIKEKSDWEYDLPGLPGWQRNGFLYKEDALKEYERRERIDLEDQKRREKLRQNPIRWKVVKGYRE